MNPETSTISPETFLKEALAFYIPDMYHQQQNKWYPVRFLLAHFEATLYLNRTEFTYP